MEKLASRLQMSKQSLGICVGTAALAAIMFGIGVWFLVSGDFLYGGVMCGCAILVGLCVGLYRAKCVMDAELRSYDERGRELSRTSCEWDYNGAAGEGELVFFKKGVSCEADGMEAVPFVRFLDMSYCAMDDGAAMVLLKDKKGVLVLDGRDAAKSGAILSRLEFNGVAVRNM